MSGATLLFIIVAILFTVLGNRQENSFLSWMGGLMTALGLGAIWTGWDTSTRNALNATGLNLWHWATTSFTSPSFSGLNLTFTVVLILVGVFLYWRGKKGRAVLMAVIGVLIVFFTLGTIFPHLIANTATALQTEAKIVQVWFQTAYR